MDGSITELNIFKLKITIHISSLWRPQYEFNLQALELDGMEVVKAHIRDANEEIKSLKAESQHSIISMQEEIQSLRTELGSKKTAFLSLTSVHTTANQQIVVWKGPSGLFSASHFAISDDARTVTVKQRGVYQIHCRLGQSNNTNCQHLGILINGTEIAQCLQADGHCYQNTAQITEVLEITAGATLTVRCGANAGTVAQPLQNRLNIVLLEAL